MSSIATFTNEEEGERVRIHHDPTPTTRWSTRIGAGSSP